ncbi:MAG: hypothetical protein Kow00122_14230 [Thermoleophilia bacterium]
MDVARPEGGVTAVVEIWNRSPKNRSSGPQPPLPHEPRERRGMSGYSTKQPGDVAVYQYARVDPF